MFDWSSSKILIEDFIWTEQTIRFPASSWIQYMKPRSEPYIIELRLLEYCWPLDPNLEFTIGGIERLPSTMYKCKYVNFQFPHFSAFYILHLSWPLSRLKTFDMPNWAWKCQMYYRESNICTGCCKLEYCCGACTSWWTNEMSYRNSKLLLKEVLKNNKQYLIFVWMK